MSSEDKPVGGPERLKPEDVAVIGLIKGDMPTAVEVGGSMAILNFLNDPPAGAPGAWAALGK